MAMTSVTHEALNNLDDPKFMASLSEGARQAAEQLSGILETGRINAQYTGVFEREVTQTSANSASCTFCYRVSSHQLSMNGYDSNDRIVAGFHEKSTAIQIKVDKKT
ncbi:hypothetical protein D5018_09280 [Parashewanella curva]|uniref:Uncharacterized protein n=1 Tax=Parashewanella curva TaxID=2338552 RepID=A0A3L8PX62_9GAMM|nr:hypothetical protein [Parashewanella curva]RLV59986.1 hypothetical protein D5018_09280 [Parashewanella curva]